VSSRKKDSKRHMKDGAETMSNLPGWNSGPNLKGIAAEYATENAAPGMAGGMASPRPAQVTDKVIRTAGGLPEWCLLSVGIVNGKPVFFWPYKSEINGKRFLTRFILFRTPLASVDITRISMADDDRAWPHDHSRSFVSWKFGSYEEWVYYNPADLTSRRYRKHRRFSFHQLRHCQAHSITQVSPGLVTVLFLGPKRRKSSYWTPEGMQSTGMIADRDRQEPATAGRTCCRTSPGESHAGTCKNSVMSSGEFRPFTNE
jgi:hypothetical protein